MVGALLEEGGHADTTFEQFRDEWVSEIADADLAPIVKGRRFAEKLITQWLHVTSDDDDFVICDGPNDGGIDVACLKRADLDSNAADDNAEEGHTWYIVQSKYGTAFRGYNTIVTEGAKVLETLQGERQNISSDTQQLLDKLNVFQNQASESDRIVLVFATTDPIPQQDRHALDTIKRDGRELVWENFDVQEVSVYTIWAEGKVDVPSLSVPLKGQFVEQRSGLLVGTVRLMDMFDFLNSYREKTGNLDQLYERNVRQFLGSRRKINKGIRATLVDDPDKFGLYNNGITIVASGYEKTDDSGGAIVSMSDPYVVNGCQTTRTLWQVLDSKLHAGGGGYSAAEEDWRERAGRGGVVTKIVKSEEAEIRNITLYTNSQNSVRERDFVALEGDFRAWQQQMASRYRIFMELQPGGTESRKAYYKQHPAETQFVDYVSAFQLVKVYGAGWLNVPGLAYARNAPFVAPQGTVYIKMLDRTDADGEAPFGVDDLYAAYQIKRVADEIGFGRNAQPSRRLSRFLFYHLILQMLRNVILLTPGLTYSTNALTDAVIKLSRPEATQQLGVLQNASIALVDHYLTPQGDNSAHNETSFKDTHNANLNGFLKAEKLGSSEHSPLLVQLLGQHNAAFAAIPMPGFPGNPTQREFVATALT